MPEQQNATISPRGGFLDPNKPLPYLPVEIQMPPVASEAAKEAMRKATAAGPVHPWTAWAESEKAAFKDNMVGVTATVPNFTGTLHDANGKPITLPHGVSFSGNHKPRIHGMDAPDLDALRFGHTHDPRPAPVEQQLKALWDESLCLDESLDRVSQKVDSISDRLATQYNADEDLFKKMNELNATLERIDARLKRLEVARG